MNFTKHERYPLSIVVALFGFGGLAASAGAGGLQETAQLSELSVTLSEAPARVQALIASASLGQFTSTERQFSWMLADDGRGAGKVAAATATAVAAAAPEAVAEADADADAAFVPLAATIAAASGKPLRALPMFAALDPEAGRARSNEGLPVIAARSAAFSADPAPALPALAAAPAPVSAPARPAYAAPAASVAPVAAPMIDTTSWVIQVSDKTLNGAMARWANTAGWQLLWELPVDYSVEVRTTLPGTFEEAVAKVAQSMESAEIPMKAVFYQGNRVLRVMPKGNQ